MGCHFVLIAAGGARQSPDRGDYILRLRCPRERLIDCHAGLSVAGMRAARSNGLLQSNPDRVRDPDFSSRAS